MIGLVIIGFFLAYLVVSVVVVMAVANWTRRNKASPWLPILAGFVMYNLVFWDWLPTVAAHQYYCSTEAGFWVYKTLDQWEQENPGVMEELPVMKSTGSPTKHEVFDDGHGERRVRFLNDRFHWVVIQQDVFSLLPVIREEQLVVDTKKNKVLARYLNYGAGNSVKNTVGPPGPLKFWLRNPYCADGERNKGEFYSFEDNFRGAKK